MHQAKPTDHPALDNVVIGSARGILALGFQDLEVVPMVGYRLVIGLFVSFPGGPGKKITKGTFLFTWFCLPVEAVLCARCAEKFLCIFE